MAGAGGCDGEVPAPGMEIIEMSDELRRRKQEIVNGLNIFLEENEPEPGQGEEQKRKGAEEKRITSGFHAECGAPHRAQTHNPEIMA
ncbi:uncharacterized protein AAEQ78_003699 isoform 1-T3 [Lycaon pictus]